MDIEQIAQYIGVGTTTAMALPIAFVFGLDICNKIFSGRKLATKQQVDEVVQREMRKLGLDNEYVTMKFPTSGGPRVRINYEDQKPVSAEVFLGGPETTESDVRHELYHAMRRKTSEHKQGSSIKDYVYREEPLAILYGWFGRDFSTIRPFSKESLKGGKTE